MHSALIEHLPSVADHLWFLFVFTFVEALGAPLASPVYVAYMGTRHPPLAVAVVGAAGTAGGSIAQYLLVRWLLRWEYRLPAVLRRLRARLETMVAGAEGAA